MDVEIEISSRAAVNRGEAKRLRAEGKIPCLMYHRGSTGEIFWVQKAQIEAVLRELEFGFLPTTIFQLKDASGKKRRAIVKDIQYQVTSYDVLHIDFLELQNDQAVDVKVPVEFLNVAECVGIKAGGFLRPIRRHIPVRCLPKAIPTHFRIDVKNLDIRDVCRVSDLIALPAGVTLLVKPQDVVATVVK